jgi:P2 family phage contractile tail tube protein
MIGNILHNYNVFIDGIGHAGKFDVKLPEVKVKTETFNAGGMIADAEIPMGQFEAMTAELTAQSLVFDVFRHISTLPKNYTPLTIRQAIVDEASGNETGAVAYLRGYIVEGNMDELKMGAKVGIKFKFAAHYYRLEHDGVVVTEIDVARAVAVMNGVDTLQRTREFLGL